MLTSIFCEETLEVIKNNVEVDTIFLWIYNNLTSGNGGDSLI